MYGVAAADFSDTVVTICLCYYSVYLQFVNLRKHLREILSTDGRERCTLSTQFL